MEDRFWQWEELFIGAVLQFPLYFIVGWWVLPIMLVCGILWRLGGWSKGHKAFRWAGVPLVICIISALALHKPILMLAAPFMVKLAPSYGVDSWLFKLVKNDFLVRLICFVWFWLMFSLGILLGL
jgi:hypothetical protein